MKRTYFISLFLCSINVLLMSQSNPVPLINRTTIVSSPFSAPQLGRKTQAKILDGYGKLPLSFEANQGQADAAVKFVSRTSSYSIFLTADEAVLALRGSQKGKVKGSRGDANFRPGMVAAMAVPTSDPAPGRTTDAVLRMKLRNANPAAKVTGADQLPGTSNFFIGNDSAKWHSNVPTYAKVKYEGIYAGIDLVYYGNQRQLEYDFIVAPGVDPRSIGFDVRGAKRIRRDAHGDLVLKMTEGEIRWHKPVVYQEKDGARQLVAARYAITDKNCVGFEVANYDTSRPLYIDPLIYSTYLGGDRGSIGMNMPDYGLSIAVDSAGNAYVTGYTWAIDFPTKNALQPANGGYNSSDAFVTKINPSGSAFVYSTYLGGSSYEIASGIAADNEGNAYIVGYTASTDFPTKNPLQPVFGGGFSDAFVAKINPTGTALVYSTYLGGSGDDFGNATAVDSVGSAYITGQTSSTDFPTMNPLQLAQGGSGDAFVARINSEGSSLVYSTYLGGSGNDIGDGIAVDSMGSAYITGQTLSTDFPTMNPLQPAQGGGGDAFVAKINSEGSSLVYSTYLGGSESDGGSGIALDSAGSAYVTGYTVSTDFPTMNALQPNYGGSQDVFVAKLNPAGSALVYSTYLGGRQHEGTIYFGGGYIFRGAGAIAVDSAGSAYVTSETFSFDFPTLNPLQKTRVGSADVFVTKLNPTGSALVYSTFLGGKAFQGSTGIAVDSAANAYVTGYTASFDFPTMHPLQPTQAGGGDAFAAKLFITPGTTTGLSSSPNPSAYRQAVTFTATVTSGLGAPPNGDTVTFMNGTTTLGTATLVDDSASFTTTALPVAVNRITAVYGGDADFGGSTSNTLKQAVQKAATTTTLSSSPNPSTYGQVVTFVAVVTSSVGAPPDGETVTFMKGTTVLGMGTLNGGSARFTTSELPVHGNWVRALYSGDSNFAHSSSAGLRQFVLAPTTTMLSSSPNPSAFGQLVTFTATVTSSFGKPPKGETVTFMKGTTVVGTGTLNGGSASLTTSVLSTGTDYIKAVYGADSNFGTSTSNIVLQVVCKAATTTTLTSSQNPSRFGHSVTFTATVAPQFSGTVRGPVTFYNGTAALKTTYLNGGVAKYTTSILSPGAHTITATYNGFTNFVGSSASLVQTVN